MTKTQLLELIRRLGFDLSVKKFLNLLRSCTVGGQIQTTGTVTFHAHFLHLLIKTNISKLIPVALRVIPTGNGVYNTVMLIQQIDKCRIPVACWAGILKDGSRN